MKPCPANLDAELAAYRVSAPDGTSMVHQGLSVALKAARDLMLIGQAELDRASAALLGGGARHIFTYGFASTWVERIEAQAGSSGRDDAPCFFTLAYSTVATSVCPALPAGTKGELVAESDIDVMLRFPGIVAVQTISLSRTKEGRKLLGLPAA